MAVSSSKGHGRSVADRPLEPRLAGGAERIELHDASSDDGPGEWHRVTLHGSLPSDADEPMLLTEVTIDGAHLVAARLRGSRLIDVVIDGADMAGADLAEASLTRVTVTGARLSGAQFAQARLRDVRFVDCRLDGANFRMAAGERVRFEGCRLDHAEFNGATFEGVAWWDCDLTDAEFSKVTVTRAQLHGSTIDGLRGAKDLRPVAIDEAQFHPFASQILTDLGIVVGDRDVR